MGELKIKIKPEFPLSYTIKTKDGEVIMEGTIYDGVLSADLEESTMECD